MRTIISVVQVFNFEYDLVLEQKTFIDHLFVNKEELQSLSQILKVIEAEIENRATVELMLDFMLRVIQIANNPDAEEGQKEEIMQAI